MPPGGIFALQSRSRGGGVRTGSGIRRGSWLDLADQVERRRQGSFAFFPFGWADFAGVGGDVLSGLHFTQQFFGVAADAAGVDLDDLDLAVGIDDKGAALGEA